MKTHFFPKITAQVLLTLLAAMAPLATFAFSAGYTTAADAVLDLKQVTLNSAGDFTIRLEQGDLIQGRTTRFGARLTLDDGTWAAQPTIGAGQTTTGNSTTTWTIDPIGDPTGFSSLIITMTPATPAVALDVGNLLVMSAGQLSVNGHTATDSINLTIDLFDPATASILLSTTAVLFAAPDQDSDGVSDDDETAAGTDPLVADTDLDGSDDGEDAFPLSIAVSLDSDGDSLPDDWNVGCDTACQTASGFTLDEDDDSDGLPDTADNCSAVSNIDQTDTDGDGEGDDCDADDDGDGLSDTEEQTLGTEPLNPDTDADGVIDGDDVFPLDLQESVDSDGDGVGDNGDAFPMDASEQLDTDGDGVGDNAELFEVGYVLDGSEDVALTQMVVSTIAEFRIGLRSGVLLVGRTQGFGIRITLDNGKWAISPVIGAGQTALGGAATNWSIDPISDPTDLSVLTITVAPPPVLVGLDTGTVLSFAAAQLQVKDHALADVNVVVDFYDPVSATVILSADVLLFQAPDQDHDGLSDDAEQLAGTDPNDPDSDNDGVNDGVGTCGESEGDCDSNAECETGLVCKADVGADYGFRAIVDVCITPETPAITDPGGNSFCVGNQCGVGEGDCDSNSECQAGLVCASDVGANYGFRAIVDVCEVPTTPSPLDPGGNSFCVGNQCGVGEGDCDSNSECAAGLVCSSDVGANYGFRAIVDVCEVPSTPSVDALGGDSFCLGDKCGIGEGDCDSDSECQAGLTCSTDVGTKYGFRAIVDVCEAPQVLPTEIGGDSFCVGTQCAAGEGDCDSDNECQAGLVCATDVGANYGFRQIVDVCEAP
jgi:hypothetical protein